MSCYCPIPCERQYLICVNFFQSDKSFSTECLYSGEYIIWIEKVPPPENFLSWLLCAAFTYFYHLYFGTSLKNQVLTFDEYLENMTYIFMHNVFNVTSFTICFVLFSKYNYSILTIVKFKCFKSIFMIQTLTHC